MNRRDARPVRLRVFIDTQSRQGFILNTLAEGIVT